MFRFSGAKTKQNKKTEVKGRVTWVTAECVCGEGWGARKYTCPGAKLRLPRNRVRFVKALTVRNDVLFMGPKGEEWLWPK